MIPSGLGDIVAVVSYTFGAPVFCLLVIYYAGELLRHRTSRERTFLPLFTLVCAVAFVANGLLQYGIVRNGAFVLTAELAGYIVPALVAHLVYENERTGLANPQRWRWLLAAIDAAALACVLASRIADLYRAPAFLLGSAALSSIVLQTVSRRGIRAHDVGHRRRMIVVLVLMFLSAAASAGGVGSFVEPLPDYLVLAFFCFHLYDRERPVFFDLLVKRGAFLLVGMALLVSCLAAGLLAADRPLETRMYSVILLVLGFWISAPWVQARVAGFVDRKWLRRPYSAQDAERQFVRSLESASSEEELGAAAARALGAVFQTEARVRFIGSGQADACTGGLCAEFGFGGTPAGQIELAERPDGVPFLSDDRRLLESLAGALGLATGTLRYRIERRLHEERESHLRLLASRAELRALRAQINPHFLFNSLSVIAGLVHSKPELADETIEHLAEVFRYTLRKSEHEWTPLAEEMEFIAAYLRVEQARFGERLRVELRVDPAARHISIPAMCIQPLVENAIRHGVSAVEGPGVVGIEAALNGGDLTLKVFDNGPGFPPDFSIERPGEGYALKNVKERMRGYFGDCSQLAWEHTSRGTTVTLTIARPAPSPVRGGESVLVASEP